MSEMKPIRGIKWFKDIVNDPNRQFGLQVHQHLPEKKVPFRGPGFDSIIRLPEQNEFLHTIASYFGEYANEYTCPEAYAATIENGTIVGNSGMIITPDGYLIAETASMTGYLDGRTPTINDLKAHTNNLQWKGKIEGAVLSAANPNGGYGHHLLESFVPMLWLDDVDIDFIHTMSGQNYSMMVHLLKAMDIPETCIIQSSQNECLTASSVSFFAPSSFFLMRTETIEMVEKRLVAPRRPDLPQTRKMYLDTGVNVSAAHGRVYANIAEFRSLLHDMHYEIIDPGRYTLQEKIDLFSQASRIISPAQSGLYNGYLFAPQNADLITLIPAESLLHNAFQNRQLAGYSDCPIYPVYPELCFSHGYYMHLNGVGRYHMDAFNSVRTGKVAELYTPKPATFTGQHSPTVNLSSFAQLLESLE